MPKEYNPYRQFVGSFVPNWLMERKEISPGAKLCFSRLAQYAGKDADCRPAMKTLCKEIGVSVAQARRYVAELESAGLIERRIGGGRMANRYAFIHHPWMEPPRSYVSGHPDHIRAATPLICERAPLPDVSEEENNKENQERDNNSCVVVFPLSVALFPGRLRRQAAAVVEKLLREHPMDRVDRNIRYTVARKPSPQNPMGYLAKAVQEDFAASWSEPVPEPPEPPPTNPPLPEPIPEEKKVTPADFDRYWKSRGGRRRKRKD